MRSRLLLREIELLTYNLLVREQEDTSEIVPPSIIEPSTLSISKKLVSHAKSSAHDTWWYPWHFCSQAYAHTSESAQTNILRMLKGSDLVLYSVLKSLGAEVGILPILMVKERISMVITIMMKVKSGAVDGTKMNKVTRMKIRKTLIVSQSMTGSFAKRITKHLLQIAKRVEGLLIYSGSASSTGVRHTLQ